MELINKHAKYRRVNNCIIRFDGAAFHPRSRFVYVNMFCKLSSCMFDRCFFSME